MNYHGPEGALTLRGVTLMECVVAMGVIALVLPAAMLVFARCRADALCVRMEGAAQRSILQHAQKLQRQGQVPPMDRWVWAHADSGACLGLLGDDSYQQGVKRHEDQVVRYLVIARAVRASSAGGQRSLVLSLEHPAAAPAHLRRCIELHTHW